MVDRSHIGLELKPSEHVVEAGRLRFFARATGQDDPAFANAEAARAAGYPAIPAPPTLGFCLEMDRDEPLDFLGQLGIDLGKLLHAEQRFDYRAPIFAGDTIRFTSRVADVYEKKGGALVFATIEREARKADGTLALTATTTLVVRNG
ncbi:MaoC family dehydratase N-terminal domain-containing protein [Sphingosinicella sp.]|uniref:MaoC family dehydratase N-terminal domain-containing protein n=1 Tax=Sphingosinicella sp. TaxID=1917971 RepID=UPI0035B31344